MEYSAKNSYRLGSSKEVYEKERFSGILGHYRYAREQKAVTSIVDLLPKGISMADCPCGNGRWWSILARRAKHIIALDISKGMLEFAKEESKAFDIKIEIREGNAEDICLPDSSVDYAFSHALTKHLPIPIQYKVLAELSRISRFGVICSFGIFSHLTYEIWRRRRLDESYPIFIEELKWMASAAGLEAQRLYRCTTAVGVEHTILFRKIKSL